MTIETTCGDNRHHNETRDQRPPSLSLFPLSICPDNSHSRVRWPIPPIYSRHNTTDNTGYSTTTTVEGVDTGQGSVSSSTASNTRHVLACIGVYCHELSCICQKTDILQTKLYFHSPAVIAI